jgi:hypothetical protein
MALSLSASYVGCAVWEKRPGSEDLLFSELMIWGYLHRLRTQRRLASAMELLGPMSDAQRLTLDGLSAKEQAKLLEQLVAGMETRDPYLHGHSRRVARHSWMIARRMGLPRAEVARIRTAAAIHDVGKIKTPKAVLWKAGRLTDEEYEVIKRHPGDGALMAAVLRDPGLTSMVRHHHERADGTGYPDALSGEEIPLGARIIAVADTFDAITSERPYRSASPHKRAIDILKEEAGTKLDPDVVHAFCGHYTGRMPLALWATLAGLPERILSWLGGSVGSVASAAKVVTVAALVGGVAVTSSTFGLSLGKHHPAKVRPGPITAPRTQVTDAAAVKVPAAQASRRGARRVIRTGPLAPTSVVLRGASTASATPAHPSALGAAGSGAPDATGSVSREQGLAGKTEDPAKGTPGEEGHSQEARAKTEETSVKPKSEEAHPKSEAGSGEAKAEEVRGKTEETVGKVKEVVKEVHSKVEEAVGKTKDLLGALK